MECKAECVDSFEFLEECGQREQRALNPLYHEMLALRDLDPDSKVQMKKRRMSYQNLLQRLETAFDSIEKARQELAAQKKAR